MCQSNSAEHNISVCTQNGTYRISTFGILPTITTGLLGPLLSAKRSTQVTHRELGPSCN